MSKLLAHRKKGHCFVLSAPAGTGKTTLIQMLVKEFSEVVQSISYTTRAPRVGEISGKDYHFIDEKSFSEKITDGDFLEYVKLYGYYYGTSKKWIHDQITQGKYVFLVIDTQGAMQVKNKLDATYIFVSPPSLEVLKSRLVGRNSETEETLEKRLKIVEAELKSVSNYDYHIINDDLDTAYQVLKSILIAESHRVDKKFKNHE